MLLPGQERAVFTKETLIMNVMSETLFDNFYLGWALDLDAVRKQWSRVVFMQTNREDLGNRYREIRIPVPDTRDMENWFQSHYRKYYRSIAQLRSEFLEARKAQNK